MIKINKQPCPQKLTDNATSWTASLLDCITAGNEIPDSLLKHYRDPIIKEALKEDSFGKCIYCESKVTHVYPGDVEHLKPKSKFKELTFDWDNLGFVCSKCNNNKSDYYEVDAEIINPYIDDPDNFLTAIGERIYGRPGSTRGQITEIQLQLNREDLIERRRERLKTLRTLINHYTTQTNKTIRQALYEEIQIELSNEKEYTLCSRKFADSLMASGS